MRLGKPFPNNDSPAFGFSANRQEESCFFFLRLLLFNHEQITIKVNLPFAFSPFWVLYCCLIKEEIMDVQLQELIDKIKKDGIESASEEANKMKSEASAEAKRLLDAAQKEAANIIERGKADASKFEKAGIAAVEQASRNLVLSFKDEIQALLDKVTVQSVSSSLNDDVLKSLVPEIIKNWNVKDSGDLAVLLSEADCKKLESYFADKLAAELKKGLELKSDKNLASGFRIAAKDGSAYYDFSAESVAELMSAYLNPRLQEILKTSVKGA
jgi:V/A-type H+-transporting ATPase subunit E